MEEEKKTSTEKWINFYDDFLKNWEESYGALFKQWSDAMQNMSDKATEITRGAASPEAYKEFYELWITTYKDTFSKLVTPSLDKEIFEKFLKTSEDNIAAYKSWISTLEDISKKTSEALTGPTTPEKLREFYALWLENYKKILDYSFKPPVSEPLKGAFGYYFGVPEMFIGFLAKASNVWKESFEKLFKPWIDVTGKIAEKTAEIAEGKASPTAYEEFYNLWMDTYKETFSKIFGAERELPTKLMLESFLESFNVYLRLFKSWMPALEKMSEKASDMVKVDTAPEVQKEFLTLWVKLYEKAVTDILEIPMLKPMKEMFAPMTSMLKVYMDTSLRFSKMWVDFVYRYKPT
ncbi:MAG: hypothetical protein HY929_04355 [Euryarchaeota archaeon]|nr:hypothetical protein [Euryarchaeota archaeon]